MATPPKIIAQVGVDGRGLDAGLKAIRGKASSFSNDIKSQFAGAFAAGSIINFGKSVLDFAGNIQDLSDRLGVSITKLQEWNFAAMQTGSSKEAVANFFELLNDNRAMALAGNQAMIASFRGLGVSINDLNTKPVDEIAEIIANTVKSGNIQELISKLRDVGGRVAGELVPAMKAGIRDMADEAHRLGVVFEEKVIGRLDALGDRLTTLQMKLARLAGTSGPLTHLLDSVESTINRASVLIAAFQGLVKGGISGAQDEVLKELIRISAKYVNQPKPDRSGAFAALRNADAAENLNIEQVSAQEKLKEILKEGMTVEEQRNALLKEREKIQERITAAEQNAYDEQAMRAGSSEQEMESLKNKLIQIQNAMGTVGGQTASGRRELMRRWYEAQGRLQALEERRAIIARGARGEALSPEELSGLKAHRNAIDSALNQTNSQKESVPKFQNPSDQLIRIGNFLGTGGNAVSDVQRRTMEYAKTTAANTTKLVTLLGGNMGGTSLSANSPVM